MVRCHATVGDVDPFTAPEAVFGTGFDPFPVDIWAYGCCVYYMLVARPPFERILDRNAIKEQLDTRVSS